MVLDFIPDLIAFGKVKVFRKKYPYRIKRSGFEFHVDTLYVYILNSKSGFYDEESRIFGQH